MKRNSKKGYFLPINFLVLFIVWCACLGIADAQPLPLPQQNPPQHPVPNPGDVHHHNGVTVSLTNFHIAADDSVPGFNTRISGFITIQNNGYRYVRQDGPWAGVPQEASHAYMQLSSFLLAPNNAQENTFSVDLDPDDEVLPNFVVNAGETVRREFIFHVTMQQEDIESITLGDDRVSLRFHVTLYGDGNNRNQPIESAGTSVYPTGLETNTVLPILLAAPHVPDNAAGRQCHCMRMKRDVLNDQCAAICAPDSSPSGNKNFKDYGGEIDRFAIQNSSWTTIRVSHVETPDGTKYYYKDVWVPGLEGTVTGDFKAAPFPATIGSSSDYVSLGKLYTKDGKKLPEGSYVRLVMTSDSVSDPQIGEYFRYVESENRQCYAKYKRNDAIYKFKGTVFGVAAEFKGIDAMNSESYKRKINNPGSVKATPLPATAYPKLRKKRDLFSK